MKRHLLLLPLLAVLSAPGAADLRTGYEAYLRGDYATAFREWLPRAEQGDAFAQTTIGGMYANGQVVLQDYEEAVRWFRKAAEQGNAVAQNNLGVMYAAGRGVPQDYVQAHMWFNLAAARGSEAAGGIRDTLATQMTPAQLAKAQRLAREWREKHPSGD